MIRFRTELRPAPLATTVGYENRILALGSCFAGHVAARLAAARFRVTANPTGILFNPLSIAAAVGDYGRPVRPEELGFDGEVWYHHGFHGAFSAPTAREATDGMNRARQAGAEALAGADRVILTFGTAWVWERGGEVVANCHRRPAAEFTRRRLSVAEVVAATERLLDGPLAGKRTILTVSPVRHLGDGLEDNALSKATLRVAVAEICERRPEASYFPAYEILLDDLRDYRFYADDLCHPSAQAVEYVWERFAEAALTARARELLPAVEAIVAAAAHRPRHPEGEAHRALCRRMLDRIASLPEVDFHEEETRFRHCLEINS